MTEFSPLSMSQTKDDLVKHLGIPPETYILMAKETDQVYKWLTRDPKHLKSNCKRNPPYDWSDVLEIQKDHAMQRLVDSGDMHTKYYWDLAVPTPDKCPNWIARWFLYHKFRYRDGRNRSSVKDRGHRNHQHRRQQSSQHEQHIEPVEYGYDKNNSPYSGSSSYAEPDSQTGSSYQYYNAAQAGDSSYQYYDFGPAADSPSQGDGYTNRPNSKAYDPVRDEFTT